MQYHIYGNRRPGEETGSLASVPSLLKPGAALLHQLQVFGLLLMVQYRENLFVCFFPILLHRFTHCLPVEAGRFDQLAYFFVLLLEDGFLRCSIDRR